MAFANPSRVWGPSTIACSRISARVHAATRRRRLRTMCVSAGPAKRLRPTIVTRLIDGASWSNMAQDIASAFSKIASY